MINNRLNSKSFTPGFSGSLKMDCDDRHGAAQKLGKKFRAGVHGASETLINRWDDHVLMIKPEPKLNGKYSVRVSLDRNPDKEIRLRILGKPAKKIKQDLINAFDGLSKHVKSGSNGVIPKKGDVYGCSNPVIKYLTRIFTGSKTNHVSIMADDSNLLEAIIGQKPQKVPFYKALTAPGVLGIPKDRQVYLCELSSESRQKLSRNEKVFDDFVRKSLGKTYDHKGFFMFPVKKWLKFPERTDKLLCSQMVGEGLRKIGLIPKNTNVSAISPRNIMDYQIYTNIFKRISRIR